MLLRGVFGSGWPAGAGRRVDGGCENYDCRWACRLELQAGVWTRVAGWGSCADEDCWQVCGVGLVIYGRGCGQRIRVSGFDV